MQFLYFLENLRNPVFDFLFSAVTHLGEETFFLVFAILFFWCINKREGYYILMTGLVGTVINQGLKLACRIERPWVKNPSFSPVESAVEEATGYSFPSGHTQNIAGTFGAIAMFTRKNLLRIASVVIIVLVSFSRMYLGVHTPWDVGASLCIAVFLIVLLHPVFKTEESFNKYMPYLVGVSAALSLALMIYVHAVDPTGIDEGNLASARENAASLFGCLLGLLLVYPLDRFVIRFETSARWYVQIIKLALGLLGVLAIKAGLKTPLGLIIPNIYAARVVRYFLIVAFAGGVWPLTFKFFSRWRIGFMERFTSWLTSKFAKKSTRAGT
ncbi:MAG: phosphatase PAP2 family protein [Clostridia bacterium]|nr:phosphatase PAP2 family protein [Clostridia bacterium]